MNYENVILGALGGPDWLKLVLGLVSSDCHLTSTEVSPGGSFSTSRYTLNLHLESPHLGHLQIDFAVERYKSVVKHSSVLFITGLCDDGYSRPRQILSCLGRTEPGSERVVLWEDRVKHLVDCIQTLTSTDL